MTSPDIVPAAWSGGAVDGVVEGVLTADTRTVAILAAQSAFEHGSVERSLVATGASVVAMAFLLWITASVLSVPVSRRPRAAAGWARRKAGDRVRAVADALGPVTPPFPREAVVSFDARRRQMSRRTLILLGPVFVINMIGFAVGMAGWLAATAPWRDDPSGDYGSVFILYGLIAGFLIVSALVLAHLQWINNQVADLFAVRSLLRATALCLELRDPGVDSVGVRREINGQLGWAAGYVRRHVGKVLPLGVRRRERRHVASHADRLATAIRRLQVTVTQASRAEVAAMAPHMAQLLAALVEDRLGDLPAAGPPPRDVARSEQIFLCYASIDHLEVKNLRNQLVRDGHNPWMDVHDVLPGDQWKHVVIEAIRSSGKVLVCLSAAAVASRGFHQKEISMVLDVAQEFPDGVRFVVPVRLEPCEVPRALAEYHWVDLFERDGYHKLSKVLGISEPTHPGAAAPEP